MDTLKLGWIPFWNLHPFRQEILKAKIPGLEIKAAMPTVVNRWLSDGAVHMGPSSSICLLQNPFLEMALPMGVTSDGVVRSVIWAGTGEHSHLSELIPQRTVQLKALFSRVLSGSNFDARRFSRELWETLTDPRALPPPLPPQEAPLLRLTPASASSAALSRLLYVAYFGIEAYRLTLTVPHHTMPSQTLSSPSLRGKPLELFIGDEALERRCLYPVVFDLGLLWKEMTGLPFVFSVWQSRGAFLNGWRKRFLEIGERAETRMKVEPTAYIPSLPPLDETGRNLPLADYWKGLTYKFKPQDLRGLLMFLCLCRHLQALPMDDALLSKIVRWEDKLGAAFPAKI